ncbi:putative N-acetyltransferase YjcF [Pseudovibrio axinellae]|uniref:Putative N-acetyltransferase YjcF n=1 Tax=Pseudovibrio axinellae TaxID=989403 RepID=A0A165WYY3_9HYPH|nr:GNAT family N-acetyltransferase [Pseudovibrio axinellae]KZL17052.1 putative N-acetyltransferase YjcF [Pseudovibrio axinellae]SEQ17780.1 Predicted N-acyltransferase, GNAT family [Pseudovibrio axinellae]
MEINLVQDSVDFNACIELRRRIFIDEQGVPLDVEQDGQDQTCIHVIAKQGGVAVGTARFQYIGDSAKIQRVCVPKEFRGKHIGAEIIKYIVQHVRDEGRAQCVRLGAQVHALGFYEKLGFRRYGSDYIEANIVHTNMEINVAL